MLKKLLVKKISKADFGENNQVDLSKLFWVYAKDGNFIKPIFFADGLSLIIPTDKFAAEVGTSSAKTPPNAKNLQTLLSIVKEQYNLQELPRLGTTQVMINNLSKGLSHELVREVKQKLQQVELGKCSTITTEELQQISKIFSKNLKNVSTLNKVEAFSV